MKILRKFAKMEILAIDPANLCGVAWTAPTAVYKHAVLNLKPRPKRKNQAAEHDAARYLKLWTWLEELPKLPRVLVYEAMPGRSLSKRAAEIGHGYRSIIQLWGMLVGCRLVPVTPQDLKRFATGRCNASKEDMIRAANEMWGYKGIDDNEADALMLLRMAIEKEF